ncbi:excalibur calcium-binding domain-containing protein [Caulobacter sp. 17J80-11]|uniref:excalibur calcium-binding domain-containing protein n=1 Tax=Caulobacter sp. 17J80-11 TaxID=2763502 RepID=UPI00165380C8|nr:excalibur calcium-binding domain-containing protein [Caulobacter sp. 17J80-11]
MWKLGVLAGLLLLGVPAVPALAHPGGLNSEGCHTNRKSGDYHCHRKPSAQPASSSQSSSGRSGGGSRPYPNCAAARAAGAAPIYRGDPGYGPHLDRDNDGIGCE